MRACVGAVSPADVPGVVSAYGSTSACWKGTVSEAAACLTACITERAKLAEANPAQAECGAAEEQKDLALSVTVANEERPNSPVELEWGPVVPGSTQTLAVTVNNNGQGDLRVEAVALLPVNADQTAANAFVSVDFGDTQPSFPHDIAADESGLLLSLTYLQPADCTGEACFAAATLEIRTNDLEQPTFHIVVRPPNCVAKPGALPASLTFNHATAAQPETITVRLTNSAACPTTVQGCQMVPPSADFALNQSWPAGSELLPDSDGDQNPLEVQLTYLPTAQGNAVSAALTCVFGGGEAPLSIPVTVPEKSSAAYELILPGEDGFLDFTTVLSGCESRSVVLFNSGTEALLLQSWYAAADPSNLGAASYTVSALIGDQPAGILPMALSIGQSAEFVVEYCGTPVGANGRLELWIGNGTATAIKVPLFGGPAKSCLDFAPGEGSAPKSLNFLGSTGESVEREFVIYNCGNAALTLLGSSLQANTGGPCPHFSLSGPTSGAAIPPAGLITYTATMMVTNGELKPECVATIDYVDGYGATQTIPYFQLRGLIDDPEIPPTAAAGGPYTGKVGQPVTLDGSASTPGNGGIFSYNWYLIAKPAQSYVILNGYGAMDATRQFVPDKPGSYTVALTVEGGSVGFTESLVATATVEITD